MHDGPVIAAAIVRMKGLWIVPICVGAACAGVATSRPTNTAAPATTPSSPTASATTASSTSGMTVVEPSGSAPSVSTEPSFVAHGSIAGKQTALECHVFGARVSDPSSAILFGNGRAMVACADAGFTLTIELPKPAVGKAAHAFVHLGATPPLCGASSSAPFDGFGGAVSKVEVAEWSPSTHRLAGSFVVEWKKGCGGVGGALKGAFAVTLGEPPL